MNECILLNNVVSLRHYKMWELMPIEGPMGVNEDVDRRMGLTDEGKCAT